MKPESKVTIAIPTYNRSELLKASLESALAQDYLDYQVLVLDNASEDDTEAVVRSFADSRITYVRHETNIGMFRNWQLAVKINSSPYLNILSDDDILLPDFIRESVLALDNHPHTGFSVAQAGFIDIYNVRVDITDPEVSDNLPAGLINGLEFIHQIVDGQKWILRSSAVMFRAYALAAVGTFDIPHSKYMLDLNLYLRIAAQFDIFFIAQELAQVRFHLEQDSQVTFHSSGGTGSLAVVAERTDAIAYLLQSPRAEDASYRQWLAERLLHISMRRSEFTSDLIPRLNLSWSERLEIAMQEIASVIPAGKRLILVDENQWGSEILPEFDALPFVEHQGQYWGAPLNDEIAIQELERMRQAGASFMVIAWPAFWWLDYYSGLRNYLSSNFCCVLDNSRLVVFDLRL
ncbi:family 2 glycosyl transferase [Nostoc sp. 'Peltigera membranacea cyanobiont' 210A]|uniref:glycosyltransferase family 2 protein n=1 Tax=Nostoc sp. 'Peltigera membranacea cyanobiont' 210A TaxID=2014529 RepID=UPI000B950B17|nr:glycosyltransferase family A protein [Nostoc sp. 'Peltigera membranacea cyanobiont' 210A]OYD92637.1 family 2 glycosyl transferase [Nostoc sp. 'Peltigera membranacea cyanobiont' 210A]